MIFRVYAYFCSYGYSEISILKLPLNLLSNGDYVIWAFPHNSWDITIIWYRLNRQLIDDFQEFLKNVDKWLIKSLKSFYASQTIYEPHNTKYIFRGTSNVNRHFNWFCRRNLIWGFGCNPPLSQFVISLRNLRYFYIPDAIRLYF